MKLSATVLMLAAASAGAFQMAPMGRTRMGPLMVVHNDPSIEDLEAIMATNPDPYPREKKARAPKAAAPAPAAAPAAAPTAAPAAAPAAGGEVTVALIKELREMTGVGMMDCKKALIEAGGDIEAANDALRKSGLAKADKKASRIAAEGKIAAAVSGDRAVLVEVNCETDFVAKDAGFLEYCSRVANAALGVSSEDVEALMGTEVEGETLEATRTALVTKIGENIKVRRVAAMGSAGTVSGSYVHMGTIGVLVELEGGSEEVAKDIAMHVAALNPSYATAESVPAADIEKEREILTAQVADSGKPADIVAKMVDGRLNKYLKEICLDSQPFVKDSDLTVGQLLEKNGAKILGFKRIVVGEGIEKKSDDFAAEVASMAGGNL